MKILLLMMFCAFAQFVGAQQLVGVVVDEESGDTIPYPGVEYKKEDVAVSGDASGRFSIQRINDAYIEFSAVGYKTLRLLIGSNTPSEMRITLKPDTRRLQNVTVKGKRRRYRRKDNPAVALMRRVIAAKKRTDLDNRDFYKYDKYQKITIGINDIDKADLDKSEGKGKKWFADQVELCPYNNKLIMPFSVDETVTRNVYRKSPKDRKSIVLGQKTSGVNDLIQTGDILNGLLKDTFTGVDLYDNQMRFLRKMFISPIGNEAISFYRYYIVDTVKVDKDSCYHLQFLPNNQQDIGFSGELWIVADSSLHVKRCELTLPRKTVVNFVDDMKIVQEFNKLPGGEWVLSADDMVVEMSLFGLFTKGIVIRTTRMDGYSFDPIADKMFKGKAPVKVEPDAMMRDEAFWNDYRSVKLTKGESSMKSFLDRLTHTRGFKYVLVGVKAVMENFVETGSRKHPSKVDIGPINTLVSNNFIDGIRVRASARTTANLNPHWFLLGYYARGKDSKKNYYKGELTYSFNKKKYSPYEFPKRTLTFASTYDVSSPSDKFLITDKDNVFTSLRWTKVEKMMFYNRQQLSFEYETDWGFKTAISLKAEENEACGDLFFKPLSEAYMGGSQQANDFLRSVNTTPLSAYAPDKLHGHGKMRTTEARLELRYSPNEKFINTKQQRIRMNDDAPIFMLSHAFGFEGVLGGDYSYNYTEASIYKRLWLGAWGKMNLELKGGAQWNKVPYPLLIMPAANMSYVMTENTFCLMNNMEFLNDRFASLNMAWDLEGKIFNRIPLMKKLKWREWIDVKCLWGTLTDRNNPLLARNAGDALLMQFPDGTGVMDWKRPYVEVGFGIHNIFKFFHVEYVRRLTYLDRPGIHKDGIRVMMHLAF